MPDAANFSRKLKSDFGFSFDSEHFRFLSDDAATKSNIISGLTWLVSKTGPYDVGVFYYSGHGTQVADQAPPGNDEADRLDEAIVPHDTNTKAANPLSTIIRDDEINGILAGVDPDAHFVVVFDSCHSGTGSRQAQVIPDGWESRSAEVSKHAKNLQLLFAGAASSGLRGSHTFAGANHLLLAASHSSQLSWEFGSQGVFTKTLIANMNPGQTYADVMATVMPAVNAEVFAAKGVKQNPQIEEAGQGLPSFTIVI